MARHGYLGDDYGTEYDPGYDADDDRRRGDWRGQDRDRDWRSGRSSGDRGGFMLDRERGRSDWQDDDRSGWDRGDQDRGFFGRMGERTRSLFSDEDSGGRMSRDYGSHAFDRGTSSGERFSSHPDDHYRSWRDKQMQALDRDYADYCREREQQFHSDFDAWRSQRRGNQEPLRTGMTQTAQTGDMTGEMELSNRIDPDADTPDPMSNATSGTTTSEMAGTGKGRRS